MPLAIRTDVIDQILAMALHPTYDSKTAKVSVETILNLTQSPETHAYIVRREVVEKMLEICEQRYKMINQQLSLSWQRKKEDPMGINVLKYVTVTYPPNFPSLPPVLLSLLNHTHAHIHITQSHTHSSYMMQSEQHEPCKGECCSLCVI